jgi:hypothetical protein
MFGNSLLNKFDQFLIVALVNCRKLKKIRACIIFNLFPENCIRFLNVRFVMDYDERKILAAEFRDKTIFIFSPRVFSYYKQCKIDYIECP